MPEHHEPNEVIAGEPWEIPSTLLDANGSPVDLTEANLKWALVDSGGNRVAIKAEVTITDAAAGAIFVSVGADDTAGLVSGTGLGTGTKGNEGLRIPEAAVGHRQPKPADLPLQEEQGNVPAPYNPPAAQNNARAGGGSKRDSGSTGNDPASMRGTPRWNGGRAAHVPPGRG